MDGKCVNDIGQHDFIRFNNEYILQRGYSSSYQNQVVNAVKLYFGNLEFKSLTLDQLHRPRREKCLPNVISKESVRALLDSMVNLKHRTMISLIYACGCGKMIALLDEYQIQFHCIPCVIVMLPIFWNRGPICGTFRSYWGTTAVKQQKSTRL